MILVKATDNLGNQMFQYAFAFATARRLKTSFCMNRLRKLTYFQLGGDSAPANALRKLRFKFGSLARRPAEKKWLDYNEGRYTAPEKILAGLDDHAVYRGYFQSNRYYAGCETEVKSLFQVQPLLRRRFEQRYTDYLQGPPLAVLHVRGKDYDGWDMVTLPWSYYENCLERVTDKEKYRWLVVTDDIDFTRKKLPADWKMELVSGDVIDDFQLMNRAAIHIMANSTFSWWAAYLNPNPSARIMGPKFWFGHKPEYLYEAPEGIMNTAWEWVETGATQKETA